MQYRLARRLIAMPLAVLAAAVLLWMALPFLVSTTLVRSAVEREITELVGRPVALGRAPEISLFPTPSARLSNVIIPGVGDGPALAEIDLIETEMTIGSIVRGKPVFSRVHMIGPHLRVAARSTVSEVVPLKNISDAVDHVKASEPEAAAPAPGADTTSAQAEPQVPDLPSELRRSVGTFTFEDGTISFAGSDGAENDITDLTGRFEWPRLSAPANVRAEFAWRNRLFTFVATNQQPLNTLAGKIARLRVQFDCDLFSFTFDGDAATESSLFADGEVGFNTTSLRETLRWADSRIRPGRALGAVALNGPVILQMDKLRFDNLQIDVEGNAGTGFLELAIRNGEMPRLSGTLDFTSLDLSAFLGAFVSLPASVGASAPVNLDFMDQVATDLRISAASASFGAAKLSNLAATAQTTRDVALFDVGDAEAYGGNVQGRLRFDREAGKHTSEIVLAGQGIDTAALASEIRLPDIFPRAVGDVSMRVTAPLGDWSALAAQGTGSLVMKMASGSLAGFSPGALAQVQSDTGFQALLDNAAAALPFESADVEGAITDGVMLLRKADLRYPAEALVSVRGLIPLSSRSLALTAHVKDPAASAEQRVFIGGSWNDPYATPVLPVEPPAIGD